MCRTFINYSNIVMSSILYVRLDDGCISHQRAYKMSISMYAFKIAFLLFFFVYVYQCRFHFIKLRRKTQMLFGFSRHVLRFCYNSVQCFEYNLLRHISRLLWCKYIHKIGNSMWFRYRIFTLFIWICRYTAKSQLLQLEKCVKSCLQHFIFSIFRLFYQWAHL